MVFGHVVRGQEAITHMSTFITNDCYPTKRIEITDCGEATEYMENEKEKAERMLRPITLYTDYNSIEC